MAKLEIAQLPPASSELFQDSESFLNELSDRDIGGVKGGIEMLFGVSLSATTAIGIESNSFNANTVTQRIELPNP